MILNAASVPHFDAAPQFLRERQKAHQDEAPPIVSFARLADIHKWQGKIRAAAAIRELAIQNGIAGEGRRGGFAGRMERLTGKNQ